MTEQLFSNGASNAHTTEKRDFNLSILLGAFLSLSLVASGGYWAYSVIKRDVSGIPVIAASPNPMRVAPENPGGLSAEHQDLSVTRIAAQSLPPNPDAVDLAPQSISLTQEDVPMIETLDSEIQAKTQSISQIEDGLRLDMNALADQIAAGAAPLSSETVSTRSSPGQSDLVTAALELALSTEQPQLERHKFTSIIPRPRPNDLATHSTAPRSDSTIISVGTPLVQFGAYDSKEIAQTEWMRLKGKLSAVLDGHQQVIERAERSGRVFYRLRAAGFDDLSQARRFCSAISSQADCIPVLKR